MSPGAGENGYCESFNARMRDEFPNGELFGNMYEVKVLTECWVKHYNTVKPHSSLGYKPPTKICNEKLNKKHLIFITTKFIIQI